MNGMRRNELNRKICSRQVCGWSAVAGCPSMGAGSKTVVRRVR